MMNESLRTGISSEMSYSDLVVRWPRQSPTNGINVHRKVGEYFKGSSGQTISGTIPRRHYLIRESLYFLYIFLYGDIEKGNDVGLAEN